MESSHMNDAIRERLKRISVLVCDVDGTLTNGTVTFTAGGDELKSFCVHDGLGIALAILNGLEVVFMTGRTSVIVERRAAELGVSRVMQGVSDKRVAIESLMSSMNTDADSIAYIGDDLNDIPAMRQAGFVFAVSDACDFVRSDADYVLTKRGGDGAVREAIEIILDARIGMVEVNNQYIGGLSANKTKPIAQ